jgi:hypothetical protein
VVLVSRSVGLASSWLHLWRSRAVGLEVPKPRTEAVRVLRDRLRRTDRVTRGRGGYRTKGRVSEEGDVVLYAARPGRGNGWLRSFRGRVESHGGGSRVVGAFRATLFARALVAFGMVVLSLVTLLAAVGVIVGTGRGDAVATPFEACVVSGLMLLAWWGLTTWGMRRSFDAEDAVLRWLADELGVTTAPPGPRGN